MNLLQPEITSALQPMILGIDGLKWMDPDWLFQEFGGAFFWVSLVIIFVECGLLFPFLPGDTLLIAIGLFAANPAKNVIPGPTELDLVTGSVLLVAAAFAGNVAGYEIGTKIGPPLYERDGRIVKRKYLAQTEAFFDNHGNKALVIGRFVPFVRTYITVVAGVTRMPRQRFLLWSFVGAVLWVESILLFGFFLGSKFPIVTEHIDLAILVILAASAIPIAIEWLRHRMQSRKREPKA